MLEFLKVFLRGIICTILLPFIVLVWVLYGVYCLITFIVMFIKATILFFKGDSLNNDMKEDVEAKKMLDEKEQAAVNAQNMMNAMYQTAMAQVQAQQMMQNGMTQPMPQQPVPPFEQAQQEPEIFEETTTEETNTEEVNVDEHSY